MEIKKEVPWDEVSRYADWHRLVWASSGFTMLDRYATKYEVDHPTVTDFANRCNARKKLDTLHPKAPVTAVPIDRLAHSADTNIERQLENFRADLQHFLQLCRDVLRTTRVVVDLRSEGTALPRDEYVAAVQEVFGQHGEAAGLEHVIIFT